MPKRTDTNQQEIMTWYRELACVVVDLHELGRGVPDLLVWNPLSERWMLVECKSLDGKLTQAEIAFRNRCPDGAKPIVVRVFEDVIKSLDR
jgi:hypothetical protein